MDKAAVTIKEDPAFKGSRGSSEPAGAKGKAAGEKGPSGAKGSGGSGTVGTYGSIKRRFLLFSAFLFLVILIAGSAAFLFSMRQVVRAGKSAELKQSLEIERITLEASVNAEIAIAMKWADSPLMKRYFQNPENPALEAIAFEEIAGYRRAFASNSLFWLNDIDKRFYSDDAFAYVLDADDPAQYWYRMTLNETEEYNFNINYNPDLNVTNLWINAPVFADDGRPIGVLGTGIVLTSFIDSIYSNYSGDAALYFFNDAGEITGAKDSKLVADKVTIAGELGKTGEDLLAAVKSGSLTGMRTFPGSGGEIAVCPVPALGWYAVAILPLTLGDYLNTSMTALFIIMMGVILVIFVIFNLFIRTLVRPLSGMVTALNQISEDWDLSRRLDARGNDEFANLADFFNRTFEKFRELLHGIKLKTFSLADTGEELSANMDGTNTAIDNINTVLQGIRGQVLNQADEVNRTAGSMERIIRGLDTLNSHINVQAESVAQSSSAIEEMLASIQSVTDTLVRNTKNISSLAESSGVGRADLQKVSSDIQEIAKESEGLLEINSVMQNIASQTNLLAMNAAIEAAHAGESGRGFAVVADEIRKLAENSGSQSKTISTVLKKIKASIDLITKSTSVVLERFETIETEVETVSNQEARIRGAMEEQGVGSRNILDAVTRLNEVTGLVQRASSDMTSETREAMNQSASLKTITAGVAGSMDEMTESADQITNAVTRVKEISLENKENINSLSAEIARFKVEK